MTEKCKLFCHDDIKGTVRCCISEGFWWISNYPAIKLTVDVSIENPSAAGISRVIDIPHPLIQASYGPCLASVTMGIIIGFKKHFWYTKILSCRAFCSARNLVPKSYELYMLGSSYQLIITKGDVGLRWSKQARGANEISWSIDASQPWPA